MSRTRTLVPVVLTATAGLTAGAAAPAASAHPSRLAPIAGCHVTVNSLKSFHYPTGDVPDSAHPRDPTLNALAPSVRSPLATGSGARKAIGYLVRMRCARGVEWRTTIQIRLRRTGPDKNVAYRSFKGTGDHTFTAGYDCKSGQSFNGNFIVLIPGLSGSTSYYGRKNVKCT